MANPVDPVLSHHTSQEKKQPAAVPELPNDQPHQSPKQSHAKNHTEQVEATSGEDHLPKNRQASEQEGAPQSGSSTHESLARNIFSTSKTSTYLHRLQEGLRLGLACSFVGNHEEV